jgi:hypothetical protein
MPESSPAAEYVVEDDMQRTGDTNCRHTLKRMPYRYFCSLHAHLQGVVIVR